MGSEIFRQKVRECIGKGILVSPSISSDDDLQKISELISNPEDALLYLNKEIALFDKSSLSEVNWLELEQTKAKSELMGEDNAYVQLLDYLSKDSKPISTNVKIVSHYDEVSEKREVNDFAMYFNARLSALQKILYARSEMKSTMSIGRILGKKERENISLIGMVLDKQTTKNGNIMLTIEDNTGQIKVLVNKNKPEIFEIAQDCVLDEVIGVVGVNGENIVFANNVILPDIPQTNELKKCEEEAYALFLSDIHVGSNNFLEKDFERFIKWINGNTGTEAQKRVSSKVKYIFIVGDLVDGVGIYPNQEDELTITDIKDQYKYCADLLSKIPSDIDIIICAGNHDALRIAEPQPILKTEFAQPLIDLPNCTLVSNPSIVNIHSNEDFSGYNVLLYHGYSFDYYAANVDSIRNGGGYDRADLIMKFLLKRRHLAPTHTSTLYVPYSTMDPLVISQIPDIFVTGHIHKTAVSSYRNITLISGSCWQSKTAFQEKVGHHPEPSRVPIVNLSTREVKILRFGK